MSALTRRQSVWIAVWAGVTIVSVVGHSWSWRLGREVHRLKAGELTVTDVRSPDSDRPGATIDGRSARVLTWNDPIGGESYVAYFDPASGRLLSVNTWSGGGWVALLFRLSVYVVVLGGIGVSMVAWRRVRARHRAGES